MTAKLFEPIRSFTPFFRQRSVPADRNQLRVFLSRSMLALVRKQLRTIALQ
jgi:hypothetical protein